MSSHWRFGSYFVWLWAAIAFVPIEGISQSTERSRVVSAGGGWSSNTTFRTLMTFGQVAPEQSLSNGSFTSLGGFAQTFLLNPNLDSDGDGIADENDFDDDGDGLADAIELAGTAFNPATPTSILFADTDGDGVNDQAESVAQTNPLDASATLRIVNLGRRVTTSPRAGKVVAAGSIRCWPAQPWQS